MFQKEGLRKERIDRPIKARADDVYFLSSLSEILYLLAPRLALILFLLLFPLFSPNPYVLRIFELACAMAIIAISWDFLVSSVGLVSLGHALFFGMGGYIAASLSAYLNLPIYLTIPIAMLLGGTISTLLILPCLRLRGIYFALVTLIYPLLLVRVIEATAILGGTLGITGIEGFPNHFFEAYLVVVALLGSLFGLRRLLNEDVGMVLRAIRDNDQSVRASGINVTLYRALGVFIAAAMTSFSGAYVTHLYMFVGLPSFGLEYSVFPIAAAIVGGIGTISGPMVGAFLLLPASEILRALGPLRIVFYALLLVAFIIGKPEGIMSYLQRRYHQIERWVEV
jgi:branched-chain amino acid transport system permease protein